MFLYRNTQITLTSPNHQLVTKSKIPQIFINATNYHTRNHFGYGELNNTDTNETIHNVKVLEFQIGQTVTRFTYKVNFRFIKNVMNQTINLNEIIIFVLKVIEKSILLAKLLVLHYANNAFIQGT